MRLFLLFLILLCLLGCDWNRNDFGHPPPMSIWGIYTGNLIATYPGADDRQITVEDSVRFIFTDYTFSYYWNNNIDTSAAGRGSYTIERNLIFSNEMEPTTNPYLTIDGVFSIRWILLESEPDTLILSQGDTPEDPNGFFETIYLITLVKSDEILD